MAPTRAASREPPNPPTRRHSTARGTVTICPKQAFSLDSGPRWLLDTVCQGKRVSPPKVISDPDHATRTRRGFPGCTEGPKLSALNNPANDTAGHCSVRTPASRWPGSKPRASPTARGSPRRSRSGRNTQKQPGPAERCTERPRGQESGYVAVGRRARKANMAVSEAGVSKQNS